jgi:hypothetical protein
MLAFLFEYAATLGLIDVAYIHPAGAAPILAICGARMTSPA